MSDRNVLVVGAGGHARVVIATLRAAGRVVEIILDDDPSLADRGVDGVPIAGRIERANEYRHLEAVIAVGNNPQRRTLAESMNLDWAVAIHPSAVVAPGVQIGPGSVIFAGAVIQPGATLGSHVIINTGSTVDHDCVVDSFAHIAPGAHLGGGVVVGKGAFIGIGACVLPGLHIGEGSILGGNAVAIRNLAPKTKAVGIPAKPLCTNETKNTSRTNGFSLDSAHTSAAGVSWAFIGTDDPRWGTTLRQVQHDFYHLPEYVSLLGDLEHKQPMAFYATCGTQTCLIPLLRCRPPAQLDAPTNWCELQSPYGYPGPLFTNPADLDLVTRFFEALRVAADELGACTIFLRLHPLLNAQVPQFPDKLQCNHLHGETVSIDLVQSEEEMWMQTRSSHRYDIRRLEKLNFSVAVDSWWLFQEFIDMYSRNMTRLNAAPFYLFNESYFAGLRDALGGNLHLCCVISPERVLAAGGLFTNVEGIMQYHLSASNPEYQYLAPTKLMLHAMRTWAKHHGCTSIHLGGGLGGSKDSLFEFKAGFSKRRHNFESCRIILNEQKYAVLVLRSGLPIDLAGDLDADRFPCYRFPEPANAQ